MNGTYLPAWRLWITTASGGLHAQKSNEQCLNQESGIRIRIRIRIRKQHTWYVATWWSVGQEASTLVDRNSAANHNWRQQTQLLDGSSTHYLEVNVSYDDLTGFNRLRC